MENGLDKFMNRFFGKFEGNPDYEATIERIEFRAGFRAPEMAHITWEEIALFVKGLPVPLLASFLAEDQHSAARFLNEEELSQAISGLRLKISKVTKYLEEHPEESGGTILQTMQSALKKLEAGDDEDEQP